MYETRLLGSARLPFVMAKYMYRKEVAPGLNLEEPRRDRG